MNNIEAKRKKTKSRNGCLTCKKKRLKCDETRPTCLNCTKKNLSCGGYATNFKWKSFNDEKSSKKTSSVPSSSTFNTSPHESPSIQRAQSESAILSSNLLNREPFNLESSKRKTNNVFNHYIELASISMTGKSIEHIKLENDLISRGINPNTYKQEVSHKNNVEGKNLKRRYSDLSGNSHQPSGVAKNKKGRSLSTNSSDSNVISCIDAFRNSLVSLTEMAPDENIGLISPESSIDATPMSQLKKDNRNRVSNSSHPSISGPSSFSPNFSDILNSEVRLEKFHGTANPNYYSHNLSVTSQNDTLNLTPSLSALISYAFTNEQREKEDWGALFEIPLSPLNLSNRNASAFLDQDGGQSPQTIQPLNTSIDSSLITTATKEQILLLYSQYTCSIMSIKNGPGENPWRNKIMPQAQKYPCLFNSIASMTFFHLSGTNLNERSALRAKGFSCMKTCILELASDLTKLGEKSEFDEIEELPSDIALTTCINLAVSECWDRQISSGIAHLKGAKSMILRVINLLKHQKLKAFNKKVDREVNLNSIRLSKNTRFPKVLSKLVTVDSNEWDKIITFNKSDQNKSYEDSIIIPETLEFLFNAWIYFEVLAQMTADINQDDKGIDLVATITEMTEIGKLKREKKATTIGHENNHSSPSSASETSESSLNSTMSHKFNIFDQLDNLTFQKENIDPLLGCAQSLFSIMGKVAGLICKIRKEDKSGTRDGNLNNQQRRNTLSTITTATSLKHQLNEWKPKISSSIIATHHDNDSSATWDVSSIIATAEAYRYATLIYLHQAVPEIPSLTSHELAEKIFVLLASIPVSSNTFIVHIFPLLISSCEAISEDEREWCTSRWSVLSDRMKIGNIDKAFEVVKEVWKRKDKDKLKSNANTNNLNGFKIAFGDHGKENPSSINSQISGLMAAISNNSSGHFEDLDTCIFSKYHWSSVMKEWGWEILLG